MSYLPATKWGDCSQCPNKDCACVKRGKDLWCLNCARNSSAKKQVEKAKEKSKVRMLMHSNSVADSAELDDKVLKEKWFQERRKEMTGKCLFCGGKTEKQNDKTFRSSVAHLLAKKNNFGGFPSVALHKDNWLELCYYNNSCHDNFDRRMITWELLKDSQEWDTIVEKFKKLYPFIAENEKRNLPELLIKELNVSTS